MSAYRVHTAEGAEWGIAEGCLILSVDGRFKAALNEEGDLVTAHKVQQLLEEWVGWDPDNLTITPSEGARTSGLPFRRLRKASSWDITGA